MLRTSLTHPLHIATLDPGPGLGRVGLTFCPGKQQRAALTGAWSRDLGLDLEAVEAWGAAAVLTLLESHEIEALGVAGLAGEVRLRHMDWLHAPIADVSVPTAAFEQAWDEVGGSLLARLRTGFSVMVHCKGGLGRAGMIAARLLVELGWAPAAAIAQVRAVRPGAIETQAQERYALALRPTPEPQPEGSPDARRDRALGALLGLAVGDAVGTTLEFCRRDSYAPLTDMVGGGPFNLKPGQWTDDTAMALALAESLAERGGLDERDLLGRFVAWWETGAYSCTGRCFDIGGTTAAALSRWRATGDVHAGSPAPEAAGNGSLMRLSPVAIRYWRDPAALRDAAVRQSRTTHAAPEAVDACALYAGLLAEAIEGAPRAAVLAPRGFEGAARVSAAAAGAWRGRRRQDVRASGYVIHALEAALWSVGRTCDFRSAVLMAANLGEDADTTAAIAGQLAGALYGARAIPAEWLQRLAWRERLEAAALALWDAACGRR